MRRRLEVAINEACWLGDLGQVYTVCPVQLWGPKRDLGCGVGTHSMPRQAGQASRSQGQGSRALRGCTPVHAAGRHLHYTAGSL